MTLNDDITAIEDLDDYDLKQAFILLQINHGAYKPEFEVEFETKRQRAIAELRKRGFVGFLRNHDI